MRHLGLTFVALCLARFTLGAAAGTQVVPPFKSQTDLIEVDAVVTDDRGDPVEGLGRGNFSVEEDGHPVAVSTFAEIDADRARSTGEGRFIVLLFDARLMRARPIVRMIVDRMTSHDVMAILSVSGSAARTTTDKVAALEQVEELERGARLLARAPGRPRQGDVELPEQCDDCGQGPLNPESADASRVPLSRPGVPESLASRRPAPSSSRVLDMIADVAKQLKAVHRRKTLVYVGNPSALELTSAKAMSGNAGPWFDAVRGASRADVSVSVIDPSGPVGRPFDGARGFTRETGGEAFVNRGDFDSIVDRIWRDAGHFYVLGYAPPNAKKGRHSIRVRVDRPDVDVRARQSRE